MQRKENVPNPRARPSQDTKSNNSKLGKTSEAKDQVTMNYKKIRLSDSSLRNWLRKHGKGKYIDFDDAERRQYRDIFKA